MHDLTFPPYVHDVVDAVRYLVDWLIAFVQLHGPHGDACSGCTG